jgi:hypothetical protein
MAFLALPLEERIKVRVERKVLALSLMASHAEHERD